MKELDDANTPVDKRLMSTWSARFAVDVSLHSPDRIVVGALSDASGRDMLMTRHIEAKDRKRTPKIKLIVPARRLSFFRELYHILGRSLELSWNDATNCSISWQEQIIHRV